MGELIFRAAVPADVPQVFELVLQRIRWMDEQGIQQWNATGYATAYPLPYYERIQCEGVLHVLVDGDEVLCAAALREQDAWWDDNAPAVYVHNFVSKRGTGAGTIMLRHAEAYARQRGKAWLRLDSAEDNPRLTAYYEALGFVPVGPCEDGPYKGVRRQKALESVPVSE